MNMKSQLLKAGFTVSKEYVAKDKIEKHEVTKNIDLDANVKYGYQVLQIGTEGISSGIVLLTPGEAELVARVIDKSNWTNSVLDDMSGLCRIDINNPQII